MLLIFAIRLSTLDLRSLYSEALFTGCYCTSRMFKMSCFCAANNYISCGIELAASLLSTTDPVV